MALTQAQRDAIFADIDLNAIDEYASNPDSLIEVMSNEDYKQGLKCGTLSLEQLNYLFLAGFLSTQKALAESQAYTDSRVDEIPSACELLSANPSQLLKCVVEGGVEKILYSIEANEDVARMHVSTQGNDSNIGTRSSPVASYGECFRRQTQGTKFDIFVDEDFPPIWKTSELTEMISKGLGVTIQPYGDTIDAATIGLSGAGFYYQSNEIVRPTIKFISDSVRTIGGTDYEYATVLSQSQLSPSGITFLAVKLDLTDVADKPIRQTAQAFFGNASNGPTDIGVFSFVGCEIILGSSFYLLSTGGEAKASFNYCAINKTNGNKFIRLGGGSSLSFFTNTLPSTTIGATAYTYFTGSPQSDYDGEIDNATAVLNGNVISTTYSL